MIPLSNKIYENIEYKKGSYLDIYYPNEIKENMPVIIYIHGGGFLWYDKNLVDEDHRINHVSYKNRLNKLGYVFISIGYTMKKSKMMDDILLSYQIADCKDAVRYIKDNRIINLKWNS